MANWLEIALILLLVGLLFGVGMFVTVGKVILIVLLVVLIIGVAGNMMRPSRRNTR